MDMVPFLKIALLYAIIHLSRPETLYGYWSGCTHISGSPDQNCVGRKSRQVTDIFRDIYGTIMGQSQRTETSNCKLTSERIDGGYTAWGPWEDCSNRCNKTTTRSRTCHNPTPCNGGESCKDLGRDRISKICRPAKGEWSTWGAWGSCQMPAGSTGSYGTGLHYRYRTCDDPPPVCNGDYCVGVNNDAGNCRLVPPCLTYAMFSEKFLRVDSPMGIFTSAQVDIYLLTKNICSTSIIVQTYYELYKMNTSVSPIAETLMGSRIWNVKFTFDPGKYEIGLYRLKGWIGYDLNGASCWMEESMYVKIEHPPPHAFIKGGTAKTVGEGDVVFDASSVSYSLTKKPGDPSGLTFDWKCLNFVTKDIYTLLEFKIDPVKVFADRSEVKKNWYETNFLLYIENKVAFIKGSSINSLVTQLRDQHVGCKTAEQIFVKAEMGEYIRNTTQATTVNSAVTENTNYMTNQFTSTVDSMEPTSVATTERWYDPIPLTWFYDIIYMYEMSYNPKLHLETDFILPLSEDTTLNKNEMLEFIDTLNDEQSAAFPQDTKEFFEILSDSSLTLNSLFQLNELPGLPSSADEAFFNDLDAWLQKANVSKTHANTLLDLLTAFESVGSYITHAVTLVDIIKMENFLQLAVDESENCLINQLGDLFQGFETIDSFDWNDMKIKEKYYLEWMDGELLNASACDMFTETASEKNNRVLQVTSQNASEGMGYLVYVKVEFEKSISYFIQHAQAVTGSPPPVQLECRFNCMKKTALTSITSLKASCPTCTLSEQIAAKFWWNVKDFDIFSRKSTQNNIWETWMLTGIDSRKFVMKANVLDANSGYLVEAFIDVNGQRGSAIWELSTNILPYDGTCTIADATWGEKNITTNGWKDEGFRTTTDPSIDWKEQLNYRIVQTNSEGKDTLLYYGAEEQNFIKLKPGIAADDYNVTVKIQIYDIFIDYKECVISVGKIEPEYTPDETSVSTYLDNSKANIEYYWNVKNIKQVGVNTEVAASSTEDLNVNTTIFDTDPSDWLDLGVTMGPNGSLSTQSFDELWTKYENPDYGNVESQNEIKQTLSSFSSILSESSELVSGTSTVNIEQIARTIGTVVANKAFTDQETASKAFAGNRLLVDKLVKLAKNETYPKFEDFIATCNDVLRVLNNALESLLPKMSVDIPSKLDFYSILDDLDYREKLSTSSNADLTREERAYLATRIAARNELQKQDMDDFVRKEVPGLLYDIQQLGHSLSMLNFRKQMPVYAQNGYINSTEDNKDIGELIQKGFQTNGVDLSFVPSDKTEAGDQDVQVTLYDHTPFSWDYESQFITSQTISVNVSTDTTTDGAIPSSIKIPNLGSTANTPKTVTLAIPKDKNEPTSQFILYEFYWKTPSDNALISIHYAVKSLHHVVYLRKGNPPDINENLFDWTKDIAEEDFVENDIELVVEKDLYQVATNVYFGLLVEQGNSSSNSRSRRSVGTTNVEYEIVVGTSGCRVWDSSSNTWDKSSCKLSMSSTASNTVCDCINPPGNNFATTFYVPPNTIDFGTVFQKFNIKDNAAVFATVVSLILLYILLCVWAFRQDKHDVERWALCYMIDNAPYDEYLYVLTIYTGLHRHAGTKSNVYFMLIDGNAQHKKTENGQRCKDEGAPIRQLDDDRHLGFGVGSVRRFVMSVPQRIKDPSVLTIWHDNSGEGNMASWYLDKVLLDDVQTNERFVFNCGKWLSVDKDELSTECAIPVCDQADFNKFSFLFNEKTRENTTENHLWLSVMIRPQKSNFSRIERLACCLTLLFLTMISNAMFYGQDSGGKIKLGPITFSLTGIYISFVSALIVAPPIFVITYMFRNSRKRKLNKRKKYKSDDMKLELIGNKSTYSLNEKDDDEENDVTNNEKFPLPFWCRYLAWIITTAAVLTSGFFLILYSMEWGKTKSEAWLACFFLSLFESMFIVDPLKVILISILLSWICKRRKKETVRYDKEKLLIETRKRVSSPLTYLLNTFTQEPVPIQSPDNVEEMRKKRKEKLTVQKTFIELVLYLVFLSVLYLTSFSNRDSRWFNIKNHIDQHLVVPNHVSSGSYPIKFQQIQTTENFYSWVNDTLLPFMFPGKSVEGSHLRAYDRQFVMDSVNYRLGPMRLRQMRSNKEKCKHEIIENTVCYDDYSMISEDNRDFCVGWNPLPCNKSESVDYLSFDAWSFVSAIDLLGLPVTGHHATYNGGGYVSEFMVNNDISKQLLKELYDQIWIDRKTRAVFTEFTLYNANNNVFVYLTFLCEFAEVGGALTSSTIQTFRPYQHVGDLGIFIFVSEIIILVAMLVFAVREVLFVYNNGRKVFKEIWNVLDVVIIVLFFICTVMYIWRYVMVDAAMDNFHSNRNKFINFSHLAFWDELYNSLLSFTIFFTTFRIMRILNYNERINQLNKVLVFVSRELCGCFFMFLLVYIAFVLFGHLIFGRYLETYKTLLISSTTLVNAIIGKNSINDLFSIEPTLGRIYYFFFVLFLLWILMTMMNASLNFGISAVRSQPVQPHYGITDILLGLWSNVLSTKTVSSHSDETVNKHEDSHFALQTGSTTDLLLEPLDKGQKRTPQIHVEKF